MKEFCRKRQLRWSGKRWLAVLLSVCLMGTMIPVTARAETGETQESGYEQEEENTSVSENDTADNESEDGEDTPDNESEDEEDTPDNTSEPEDDPAPSDDEEQTKPEEKDEVEDETTRTITAWEWIDEEECLDPEIGSLSLPGANKNNPASFDDITAFLPTRILATVENAEAEDTEAEDTEAGDGEETITLGDWECDNYPEEGAYQGHYTFTAALPEGYALSGEADALEVLVELGGAQMYETMQTASDFTITGGKNGTDYTYADGVLTIKTSTPITIANADPSTATNDRIEVAGGVSATITLDGVNIDVSSSRGTAAFKIADDSTGNVTITLADSSENKLKSGMNCAGLQKNGAYSETLGKLTIQGGENGTGKLAATGKSFGAGIGGGDDGSGSNIEITGGTVTATGGLEGAGIGGGSGGSGSDITISGGTVTATGDRCGAGIGGGYYGFGSDIEISGGNVIATGASGAGIGGGYSGSGSNIKISDCTVTANGGNSGAGIGGGDGGSGSNIEISGCIVTATSDCKGAGIGGGDCGSGSNITISGGSVKASGANKIGGGSREEAVTPTNGTTPVYLLEIPNPGSEAVLIDGVSYQPVNHKAVDGTDGNLYAYLPGKGHAVQVGEKNSLYMFDSASSTFVATFEIKATNGGALTYGTDYTYADNVLTIKTSTSITIANVDPSTATTTDRIEVADGVSANITLAGVNIDVSSSTTAAFKIADNSTGNVTITLADDSENKLISGNERAGLQKNGSVEGIGKLTIQGGTNDTGKLNATSKKGAGIGGGWNGSGSNIFIEGGTVTANGGAYGAGIGGGGGGTGSNIEISGGTVTATGGYYGAGIGGGYGGTGSDIEISGGTVTATAISVYGGAGIGGGEGGNGSNITIKGGTVTATGGENGAGIGGGKEADGSNITISGGTVTATSVFGAGIGSGKSHTNNKNEYDTSGQKGSKITISGGEVIATSEGDGAGIGGGGGGTGSDIEISGGTVTATGCGAGIGGGAFGGSGSNITISGGTVTAASEGDGAGIGGGGAGGTGSNITISGGTVTATGGAYGAGIGGGEFGSGSNIFIEGGTVTATGGAYGAGIGGGNDGDGSYITITGGSVKAVAGTDANDIGGGRNGNGAVTPTSDGTTSVYLLEIANDSGADITINGESYPAEHTYYDFSNSQDVTEKKIYAYLPAKTVADPNVVTVGTETTKYIYDTKWLIVSTAPVTAPTANKLVYTGAAQDLVTAGKTSYGTMVYSLSEGGEYTTAIPTGTDAATYTVWYKVKDGDVYADTLPASVEVTIEPAAPVITNADTVRNQSTVFGSGEFTAPTAAVTGTVTYKVGETTYTGAELKTYLAGKSVSDSPVAVEYTFTPTGTTNYKEVTGTISFTIEKATPCIKEAPTASAITYGDTLGDSALSDGTVQHSGSDATTVTGSFAWADSSVKPSVADSGKTFYQVVFTPSGADADNYTTAETKVTLTVNKAPSAPNMPEETMDVPYHCEKVSEVALPEDWVWQEADKDKELPINTQVTATAVYNGADKGNYEEETVSVSITRPEISNGLWIEKISDQTYNGKAIKPEVWVYYDRQLLTAGKDYTVSYKNNTNAAAADAVNTKGASIAPTITVKGKGNYTGTVTKTFTILPINLDNYKTDAQLQEILTIEPVYAKHNGKFIKATPTVKLNGKKLALSAKQYSCEYNDGNLPDKEAYKDCGTYNITIVGSKKNFVGETTVTETISGELISKATITLDRSSYPYDKETGETFPAKVTVKYGRNTLTEGTDYTVSYKDYDKIGTATVIITGMENYSGVKTKTYKITGTKLTTRMITQINKSFSYDGTEHSVVQGTDYKIADGTTGLVEGKHYTVSYKGDRTKAGTFKVTFAGIGAYSGTVTKTFTIQKASVQALDVTLPDGDSVFYTKGGVKPKPEVRFDGVLLTEGTDYTVTYQNNTKAASAEDKKAPYFYITGKGSFTGNTKASPVKFTIEQAPLAAQTIVIDNVPYKNRNGNYVPAITITDSTTGKKLAKNTDYLGSFTYDIWDTAANDYVPFTGKKVEASEDNIRMRVTVSAKGSYSGEASVEYEICPKSITTVKVAKIPNQDYTGKEIKPELTITDNGVELIEGTHYTLEYSNNIKKGTATVTIRGKGQYGGSRTVKFKITSRIFKWL